MAKRYDDLANALEQLSVHCKFENDGSLAREYQLASSELRTAEHIPPDPSELDNITIRVRDAIAEWRAFGKIEELERFEKERPYMTNLTEIAKVGPTTAHSLNEEAGAVTIDDVKKLDKRGKLEDVSGIGPKTATTIRRSIAQK